MRTIVTFTLANDVGIGSELIDILAVRQQRQAITGKNPTRLIQVRVIGGVFIRPAVTDCLPQLAIQQENGGCVMNRLLLIPLLFLWVHAAVAASPTVVDGNYVAEAIARNAVVWDVRAADAYSQGHIAGAVSIGDAAKILRDENTEDFIATDRIEKILGAAGLDPDRETIVYGSRGTWNPYFGLYTLRYFSGSNVRVYHEGIEDWSAAGRAISRDASRLPPVALKLQINPTVAVTTQEMIARLNSPNVQIVDARTPQEFIGEDIRAIRGGHIPGAINIPYEQNWVDPETPAKLSRKQISSNAGMSLKPSEELKRLYARLDPSKETIVYCQSGARASETAGVLQQLGFTSVKVYDSSWLGYGNTLDAPANNVTFFNVGLLNSRLSTLQDRVNRLEKELAEAKAKN
jgi:thiosulfate/3-mercaptopyruvate sulfurtransferase